MAYDDKFRFGVHAVITDAEGRVLQLKTTYGDKRWGLPGGGVEPGETIHEGLIRECREELGVEVEILYLSGIYYHARYEAHACVFRCVLPKDAKLQLSEEHSELKYFTFDELTPVQQHRIRDCLEFNGTVKSASF